MIDQLGSLDHDQLPNEIKSDFQDQNVIKHLRDTGSRRNPALPAPTYSILCSCCSFTKKLVSAVEKQQCLGASCQGCGTPIFESRQPCMTAIFIVTEQRTITRIEALTSTNHVTVFIFDDSMLSYNWSKTVEMLTRFKDHSMSAFYKGFRLLVRYHYFALLSSSRSAIDGMSDGIDIAKNDNKRHLVNRK